MDAIKAAVAKKKQELERCIPGIVWLFHVPSQYSESICMYCMVTCQEINVYDIENCSYSWAEIHTFSWSNSFDLYRCDALHSTAVMKFHHGDIFRPKLLKTLLLRWSSENLWWTYYQNKPRARDMCPLAMPAQAEGAKWTKSGLKFNHTQCPTRPERNMGRDEHRTWVSNSTSFEKKLRLTNQKLNAHEHALQRAEIVESVKELLSLPYWNWAEFKSWSSAGVNQM